MTTNQNQNDAATTPAAPAVTATSPVSPAATANTEPSVKRAAQNRKMAEAITEAGQIISILKSDGELLALLAPRGYGQAKLEEGAALHTSAVTAFAGRAMVLGARQEATVLATQAAQDASRVYVDFRETARALFPAESDHQQLGLKGLVPFNVQQFIMFARASYIAAQNAVYVEKLKDYGYPAETLAAHLTALDQLAVIDQAQSEATGSAKQGTLDRNAAFDALSDWMLQFRRIAKRALRQKPAVLQKLNA